VAVGQGPGCLEVDPAPFAQPIPFQNADFSAPAIIFTGVGAALLWGVWGRERLRTYGLSEIISLLPLPRRLRIAIEFLMFVSLGCIVGIGVTCPINPTQALAAGFGWTAAFTTRGPRTGKRDR
jgi:hypothetical protein